MKSVILAMLLLGMASQVQAQLLTDEERKALFGQWAFRNGIWEDQWDFYRPIWLSESGYTPETNPIPNNWVGFRDLNSGDRDGDGVGDGTTEDFNSYRNFVNQQAIQYQQQSIPIDGGLSILALFGLGFGVYTARKRE